VRSSAKPADADIRAPSSGSPLGHETGWPASIRRHPKATFQSSKKSCFDTLRVGVCRAYGAPSSAVVLCLFLSPMATKWPLILATGMPVTALCAAFLVGMSRAVDLC
jgi:hypothetical protein